VALKLAVQRCRMIAAKKEAVNKAERRNIASLLEKGKEETARVRVETIVNEEIFTELLEILELFCELCIARFGLIEQSREVDDGIKEAVSGILYASPKTDIKELHHVSSLFLQHYGREFAVRAMENQDNCVPTRITSKLIVQTPSSELVDLYLYEIAKAYSVKWTPPNLSLQDEEALGAPPTDMSDISLKDRETVGSLPQTPPVSPPEAARSVPIHTTLHTNAATPTKAHAAPSASIQAAASSTTTASTAPLKTTTKQNEEADFEALQRRFEALKRK